MLLILFFALCLFNLGIVLTLVWWVFKENLLILKQIKRLEKKQDKHIDAVNRFSDTVTNRILAGDKILDYQMYEILSKGIKD